MGAGENHVGGPHPLRHQNPYETSGPALPCKPQLAEQGDGTTLSLGCYDRCMFSRSVPAMKAIGIVCALNGSVTVFNMASLLLEACSPMNASFETIPLQVFTAIGLLGGLMLLATSYAYWTLGKEINAIVLGDTSSMRTWSTLHYTIVLLTLGTAGIGLLGLLGHWLTRAIAASAVTTGPGP